MTLTPVPDPTETEVSCFTCGDECVLHIMPVFDGDVIGLTVESKVRFRTAIREAFSLLRTRTMAAQVFVDATDLHLAKQRAVNAYKERIAR